MTNSRYAREVHDLPKSYRGIGQQDVERISLAEVIREHTPQLLLFTPHKAGQPVKRPGNKALSTDVPSPERAAGRATPCQ